MNNEFLTEIACPNCLAPIDVRQHGQHVTCDACSSQFLLEGHICPNCHTYHREPRAICRQCGHALTRVCPKCQTANWTGDEYCQKCGAPLDIFEMLQKVDARTRADRLNERNVQIRQMKEEEDKAAQRRMAEMMAVEEERQRELARRQAANQKRDRQMMLAAVVLMVIFVLAIVALALL
ncbi:MAG: zinc ribbon domain-containing protein [Chloroflexi bacterium]|nr:zinc ribbon domain-containing protein [Chloroflexota bacterium]MBP7041480.1 zinc ribbon domain-containing protein [Chloroflexota bacterium]